MKIYVRATGNNRYAGGTWRWLRIRSIERAFNDVYEIHVNFRGNDMCTSVSKNSDPNLEFKVGSWPKAMPVDFKFILSHWDESNLWKKKETE